MHILHITKWFPNLEDPQLGIFIKKHVLYLPKDILQSLIYVHSTKIIETDYKLEIETVDKIQFITVVFKPQNKIINVFKYLKAFRIAYKLVIKKYKKPDIIHAHVLLRTAVVAFFISKVLGIKYVISEHWSGYITGKYMQKSMFYKMALKFLVKKAKKTVVVSNTLKIKMEALQISKTLTVIPNFIDFHDFDMQKVNNNAVVKFATISDMVDSIKQISAVIDAVFKIARQSNKRFEYHIIGGGEDEQMLRQKAESLGLLNSVVFFYGRKTNQFVLDFLPTIDFLVINSIVETFSIVALEALSFGKPVLATKCGGTEEFVDVKNGMLISKNNSKELFEGILYMLENHNKYNAQELRASISRFDKKNTVKKWLKIYE